MAPVGIKWFRFINNGEGVLAYPQLSGTGDADDSTLWNPRSKKDFAYMTAVAQQVIVDLESENIAVDTPFYLSENVIFGTVKSSEEQSFVFDPKCTLVATAQHNGGFRDGSFEYVGTEEYDPESGTSTVSSGAVQVAAAITEILQSIGHNAVKGNGDAPTADFWTGFVTWATGADPNAVVAALTLIVSIMALMRYTVTWKISGTGATCTIKPGKKVGGVPEQVKKDWDSAVAQAAKKFPKIKLVNKGSK
ncbi:hypothetical protein GE09DRAFT_1288563 [Coniochaeta sp. 2T2.1]|nr:hypothetical protein GE09DRAFT_1288563 [Coniochaeta sp. 2T2.1]